LTCAGEEISYHFGHIPFLESDDLGIFAVGMRIDALILKAVLLKVSSMKPL
jgi:hypothetical protein